LYVVIEKKGREMVVDALVNIILAIVDIVMAFFVPWTPPDGPALSVLSAANVVLPLDTLANLFGVTLAFSLAALGVWGVMKVVNLVRGSGA
jgi:hypothetical protein